jgi:hypothetical protein
MVRDFLFGLFKKVLYLCHMKNKILQSIGNSILRGLEKTNNDEFARAYYDLGMWYDNFCIRYFNVYLD